jgi:hypothetical protein
MLFLALYTRNQSDMGRFFDKPEQGLVPFGPWLTDTSRIVHQKANDGQRRLWKKARVAKASQKEGPKDLEDQGFSFSFLSWLYNEEFHWIAWVPIFKMIGPSSLLYHLAIKNSNQKSCNWFCSCIFTARNLHS